MELGLDNQTVVVTGGANGIGLACAKLFLQEHARVAIWDLHQPDPAATRLLDEAGAEQWRFYCVDITNQGSVDSALLASQTHFEQLHHLVHAAAIGSGKFGFPFSKLSPDDWLRVLDVNIMGMVRIAYSLAPLLQRQEHNTLTFLASVAGQIGSQTDPPYSASKAANINFAQCLAKDLANHGVRVNVVNPGMVPTQLNQSVWAASQTGLPCDQQQTYEDWATQKIRKIVPLGRWQSADDIANAIVFLASRRAANITGQCINVDGGFVMHS